MKRAAPFSLQITIKLFLIRKHHQDVEMITTNISINQIILKIIFLTIIKVKMNTITLISLIKKS